MSQMSLLANIPGLAKHEEAKPVAAPPAPAAAPMAAVVSPPPLPYHILMRSRHGIEYILCHDEAAIEPLQAAYPELPVIGPRDIWALKGFGPEEADQAMTVLAAMPGSRLLQIMTLDREAC